MANTRWSAEQLEGFHQAAQSLKLYRRAELEDADSSASLIRELYVDPLPEEHIFRTVIKPNTTFIIGRKGTGKSTIFQRVQNELRGKDNTASAYIDIKTVYESSSIDSTTLGRLEALAAALPKEKLEALLLYRSFIEAVFSALKDELKVRLKESFRARVKNFVSGSIDELFEGLDSLIEEAQFDRFTSVLGIRQVDSSRAKESKDVTKTKAGLSVTLGAKPSVESGINTSRVSELKSAEESSFADVLIRVFNVKEILVQLKKSLTAASIKHVYVS